METKFPPRIEKISTRKGASLHAARIATHHAKNWLWPVAAARDSLFSSGNRRDKTPSADLLS
jgi:hypothetical protein